MGRKTEETDSTNKGSFKNDTVDHDSITPPAKSINEFVHNLELDISSQDSNSTKTSSSRSTIINHRDILVTSSKMETEFPSTSVSHSKQSAEEANVTQPESVKLYKNSPFGLKGHFLTMPIDEVHQRQPIGKMFASNRYDAADYDDDDDDNERVGAFDSDHEHTPRMKNLNIPSGGNLSSDQSSSDISGKRLHRFHNHRHLQLNHHSRHMHHLRHNSSDDDLVSQHLKHFTRSPNDLSSSGDVGLDAKKCNAKSVNDCLLEVVAGNKSPIDLEKKIKLVDEKLANGQESDASLLVRFSSMMYATFLVILGCILHVSELRQKSMNSSDHIYTTIVALIGIGWLLFLQTDLHKYKRYASKFILIETLFSDRNTNYDVRAGSRHDHDHHHHHLHHPKLSPSNASNPSTASSAASLVNQDRMSMNTEVILKKTAHKMYEKRAALDKYNAYRRKYARRMAPENFECLNDTIQGDVLQNSQGIAGDYSPPKSTPSSTVGSLDGIDSNNLIPAYKFLHGKMGANFYLKCGMAAFCFGHVIHEGLRFGQQLYFFGTGNTQCRDSAALVAHLVTPLYSFYQLFMMFKYSNLVINRHRILARFGLMHIIGTSITFWIRTILEEAFEDFVHKMDYFRANKPQGNLITSDNNFAPTSLIELLRTTMKNDDNADKSINLIDSSQNLTMAKSLLTLMSSPISATITPQMVRHLPDSYACAQNTLLTTKSMNTLPYLYPFTIEYNLLLAATFLSLYFNIGKVGGVHDHHGGICAPILTSSARSYLSMSQKNQPSPRVRVGGTGSSTGSHLESTSSSHSYSVAGREQQEKDVGEYKSNFVVNADCHSANKGLFCGFFVLLVTLVTIVIFFVTINKPTHVQLGIKINLIQEATLTALILIVTLAGFKQIIKLNRNPYLKDRITTDDVLMLIPLPFFFIHSLLSFRAETATMTSSLYPFLSSAEQSTNDQGSSLAASTNSSSGALRSLLLNASDVNNAIRFSSLLGGRANDTMGNAPAQMDHFKLLTIVLNLLVMIEVLVQTNFIIDGMRRCSESRYLRFKKPGRELITFAILLNITYWIVATFETKSVEQYKTEIEYYGPLPYMFISHTTLPVMLFYRYHSSVCLAEIWNRAYKPPKRR